MFIIRSTEDAGVQCVLGSVRNVASEERNELPIKRPRLGKILNVKTVLFHPINSDVHISVQKVRLQSNGCCDTCWTRILNVLKGID